MLETKLAAATILRYDIDTYYFTIYYYYTIYIIHIIYTILRSFTFERVNKGDIEYMYVMTMYPVNESVNVYARP